MYRLGIIKAYLHSPAKMLRATEVIVQKNFDSVLPFLEMNFERTIFQTGSSIRRFLLGCSIGILVGIY